MPVLEEIVPKEFHDREYLKPLLKKEQNAETFAEVFKKLDGAESLLGKRPAIPGEDSKPEELEKFFEQFRAEKPEEYEIPTEKDAKRDEVFMKLVQKSFHDGAISKVQAQKFLASLMPGMKEYATAQQKVLAAAKAKADLEFDTLAKAGLGEQNKAIMERTNRLLKEHAPAAFRDHLEKLDEKSLLIMTAVIDGVLKKYVSEDDLKGKGKGGAGSGDGAGAADAKSKRAQMETLMGSKPFRDAFHVDHDSTRGQVRKLAEEIAAIQG